MILLKLCHSNYTNSLWRTVLPWMANACTKAPKKTSGRDLDSGPAPVNLRCWDKANIINQTVSKTVKESIKQRLKKLSLKFAHNRICYSSNIMYLNALCQPHDFKTFMVVCALDIIIRCLLKCFLLTWYFFIPPALVVTLMVISSSSSRNFWQYSESFSSTKPVSSIISSRWKTCTDEGI